MTRFHITLGVSLMALAFAATAQTAARKPYIIQLKDAPIATYTGSVPGYAATQPAPGTKLKITSADVQNYVGYLNRKQAAVTATLPSVPVTYTYKTLLNGFAALLTDAEFAKLAANAAVKSITVDVPVPVATSYTPTFLGLKKVPEGVWNRTDASGRIVKGEGVIIGHIDGGVWPEDPSFSDKVDASGRPGNSGGTLAYDPLPPGRWSGGCAAATGFGPANCNNKLIGAKYFNTVLKQQIASGSLILWSGEYLDSPRDADGHGSHTLSTSGGNENSPATINGSSFAISGIAPRARVAAYKVCYVPANAQDVAQQGSCYQGDSIAAAEAAVNDGVDVINFSVGGSTTSFSDAVETAFGNAAFAGVFVAASAGNSNVFPGNAPTVAHLAPWVTTVGNSTHDRFTKATVTLANGYSAVGASFQTTGLATRELVYSRNVGFGAATTNQALCLGAADGVPALLDPAKVGGKILVCERGSNVLVNKVAAAKAAGAVGVIILNTPSSNNTTPLISAELPTVHLDVSHYAPLTSYMGNGTSFAAASFSPSVQVPGVIAPVMSDSSSRGPNPADPNLLKPDITAPGTDIIAAYTNTSITPTQRQQIIDGTLVPGPGADMISGTSMAAPHVAGAAALLKQANPTWSPFAIKSALMTSALQAVKLADGTADPSPWGFGAGHLNPNVALDTRVVYETTVADHVNYFNGVINGRTLNVASLTHANVVGVGTLTRTLTNKGNTPVTYSATASLPGFNVSVSPATLTIGAGASASYTVTLTRSGAPLEQWVFGSLAWEGAGVAPLRSPLSAKASTFVAATGVFDTRAAGTKVLTTGFGYDGPLLITPTGLLAASRVSSTISTNQLQCTGNIVVAAGTKVLRAQLFNSETEGGSASDLDLSIQRQNGGTYTTVASSGGGDSDELASVANPVAGGTYRFCINGYAPIHPATAFTLSYWILGPGNPGTLKAFGPSTVKSGAIASVGMSWNVPAGARYLGVVEFRDAAGATPIGASQIFIDNSAAAATAPAPAYAPVVRMKLVQVE